MFIEVCELLLPNFLYKHLGEEMRVILTHAITYIKIFMENFLQKYI
jgi:hypothetical protein